MTQSPSQPLTDPSVSSSIPPSQSKNLLIPLLSIVIVVLFFLVIYFYVQSQNKKVVTDQQKPIKTENVSPTKPVVSGWKTYTNTAFNYSINYPSNWVMREFSDPKTGATFRPSHLPNDYQYEYITINKNGRVMFDDLPNPTFEEYVKRAGEEIQNYKNLVSMKKVVTDSGITGYTTTWNVAPLGPGKTSESLPRTYFEIPGNNAATIQVEIRDKKYMDIYNQMISSFALSENGAVSLDQKKQSSDPNLKTYTSSKLGLSFTYLEKQNSQEMTVKENGSKICITYDVADNNCSKGQSVEVFQKGKDETLQAAITRLFLAGKDLTRCLVTISDPKNYPSTFVKGEITFPDTGDFDMEKMLANTEYCSQDYAQTNGIRYFLEDKNHPTKLVFFSIGQYGISSDNNKTWQETVSFE